MEGCLKRAAVEALGPEKRNFGFFGPKNRYFGQNSRSEHRTVSLKVSFDARERGGSNDVPHSRVRDVSVV